MTADGKDGNYDERTIARLMVAGHTDRYIAGKLRVSERTMYRLLGRLMTRHRLPNRAALGAFAASQGWLPDLTAGARRPAAGSPGTADGA